MNAEKIIGLIPDDILDQISLQTGVDNFVKKLKGKIIFKLFVYTLLNCRKVSLRILEAIFNSQKFSILLNGEDKRKIRHSSIGSRLSVIDYRYFERIFDYLVKCRKVDEILFSGKKVNIRKIDSTMVSLSSKLLKFGIENNKQKDVKYSVEINQGIPVNILFFKDKRYASENIALPELFRKDSVKKNDLNIFIFDRGINKKDTLVKLAESNTYFISRLGIKKYEVVKEVLSEGSKKSLGSTKNKNARNDENVGNNTQIKSDQIIKFYNNINQTIDQEFRLITKETEDNKIIQFITNIDFLEAEEIAEFYRSRWEIETFFKFIKQELNFSHLISRNENGIKALMYLTMTAATLLTLYKKINKIGSWAVAKIKFLDDLESGIMYQWNNEIYSVFKPPNSIR